MISGLVSGLLPGHDPNGEIWQRFRDGLVTPGCPTDKKTPLLPFTARSAHGDLTGAKENSIL